MNIPFLMYHELEVPYRPPSQLEPGYMRYVAKEDAFVEQLKWLSAAGFRGLSVGETLREWHAGANTTRPSVALTFDDGCETDANVAAPLLAEHGFDATFYVVSDWIGRPGYMTRAQVRRLADAGFEIGSHTATHPFLTDLTPDRVMRELTESRDRLEQITGEPAIHLSCPGGRCDSAVARAAREAGYESVATSRIGLNAGHADRWSLNRIAIHRGTTLPQFAAACRGRIAARQFTQRTLDAAKRVLGNGAYVTLRDGLLGRRA